MLWGKTLTKIVLIFLLEKYFLRTPWKIRSSSNADLKNISYHTTFQSCIYTHLCKCNFIPFLHKKTSQMQKGKPNSQKCYKSRSVTIASGFLKKSKNTYWWLSEINRLNTILHHYSFLPKNKIKIKIQIN